MDNGFDLSWLLAVEHEAEKYKLVGIPAASKVNKAYAQVLWNARINCPGIVLVGGAVRDTLFDREVKDLDFMSENSGDIAGLSRHLGRPLLNCLRHLPNDQKYPTNGHLLEALETEDKAVNLLLVSSIMGRINEFPDSISQCWFDGRYVYGTPAFCSTYMTHVVSYQHTMNPDRLERLKAKYPDFAFEAF